MATTRDRLAALLAKEDEFTGIDFVQVADPCIQTTLLVYFLTDLAVLTPRIDQGDITADDVLIYSPTAGVPVVPLVPGSTPSFSFDSNACRWVMEIQVEKPGDFTNYRIKITDPLANSTTPSRIDPFFNDVEFSFKAGCHDNLDCAPPEPDCPVEPTVDFPVDYLARDFTSFRNALLDFAAQKFPQWEQPTDADVGVMLTEIMAALGDEFSYIQDRYGREAYLETATQRRSLRKKARLVDYEIHDGRLASTFLELTVNADGTVDAGKNAYVVSDNRPPVVFETGRGLRDGQHYPVRTDWNADSIVPYWFDDSTQCLPVGATELFVEDSITDANLLVSDDPDEARFMLLRTEPTDPSIPVRRAVVRMVEITETTDELFDQPVTKIRWDAADALEFQFDQGELKISLNVLPATAGETIDNVVFLCPNVGDTSDDEKAVEREGPLPRGSRHRPTIFLFGLPGTDVGGLGFLGEDLRATMPEVIVEENVIGGDKWSFRRTLIGTAPTDEVFTLEDGTWRRIAAFRRLGQVVVHRDYAVGAGYTIRFGDSVFGKTPPRGTSFKVKYRLGPGTLANVPADSINKLEIPGDPPTGRELPSFVTSVNNPLAVTDGVDPESAADIKLLTPEAFQAEVLFAVRPEDYGTQAERLDFVQRAQGAFRWTGSWLTAFVAADPLGSFTLTDDERAALEALMECVRQAGRETVVVNPRFLPIDLRIHLCIEHFAHAGEVLALVRERLFGRRGARPTKGFFDPDNFTFGTPLRRSALEAAIHDIRGVRAVTSIEIRDRGKTIFTEMQPLTFVPAPDEVIRIENDALHPERGTVLLFAEGGA